MKFLNTSKFSKSVFLPDIEYGIGMSNVYDTGVIIGLVTWSCSYVFCPDPYMLWLSVCCFKVTT